jgi:hypothetical protein
MWRVIWRGWIAGVIVEVVGILATWFGLVRVLPGTVSVPAWCIFTSYYYSQLRDEADGPLGLLVASLLIAVLFVAVALVVEAMYRHFVGWVPWFAFVWSLLINWGGAWDRRPRRPRSP